MPVLKLATPPAAAAGSSATTAASGDALAEAQGAQPGAQQGSTSYVAGSDRILVLLEALFPQPSMASRTPPEV